MHGKLIPRGYRAKVAVAAAALLLCSQLLAQPNMMRADPSHVYRGYGFTISPPPGEEWWVMPANEGHKAEFYLQPSRREAKRQHSLAAAVSAVWVTGCDTAEACLDSTLEQLRTLEPNSRYTKSDVEILPSTALPPGCIRIKVLQHDRGVPGQKKRVFEIHADGMMCSHPDAPNLILNASYSERLRQRDRRRGFAQEDVETFLQSFEFKAIDGPIVDSAHAFRESLGGMTWDGERLWLQHAEKLSQIDTTENRALHSIDVPGRGMALLFADQSLWMGDYDNRRLLRLDPETGAELARLELPGTPVDMAYSHDSVWVTHEDHGHVVRVNTATNSIDDAVVTGRSNAGVVAAFGFIWVSNPNANTVYRIDPDNNSVAGKSYPCDDPLDLIASGEFVWVGCMNSGTIARLEPQFGRVLERYRIGGTPFMLGSDDRHLWIVNVQQGSVSRFDIDSGKVVTNVPIGASPLALQVADGAVWVTERSSGTLYRIVDLASSRAEAGGE